ncbi:MAG: translocation/assembly module TamB domain-containing protein [Rickettsiales bacterium]|nr:translocation/assembly module TamB domain-containing protein [Pseudomonadota bacterium]MDG4542604.1 translocation/assembly module TamB domain-containing protein [Rickettsiales bacterium]MDG4545108.1 translocation/assembly module TamB domain-containing protein [Rickettsiales bacterium]MDG4547231.1 translocation/assembly module TamB domain-containing protein [Rickettsiales bacterium]
MTGAVSAIVYNNNARTWIAVKATTLVESRTDFEFKIEGVESSDIDKWKFRNIEIYKNSKLLLKGKELSLSFSVFKLLDKDVYIKNFSADLLELYIQSNPPPKKTEAKKVKFVLPKLYPVKVDNIEVRELILHYNTIKKYSYSLKGKLSAFSPDTPFYADIDIASLDKKGLSASIKTKLSDSQNVIITADIREEKGGLIGNSLYVPEENTVDIKLTANITKEQELYNVTVDSLSFPFQDKQLQVNAKLTVDSRQATVFINEAAIDIEGSKQVISGIVNNKEISINAKLEKLPLSPFQLWIQKPDIKGSVTGSMSVGGLIDRLSFHSDLSFDGKYTTLPLKSHIVAHGNIDEVIIDDFKLSTSNEEYISLKGKYSKAQFDIKIKAVALPTRIMGAMGINIKAGKITADLGLKGSAKMPLINGNVNFITDVTDNKKIIPITLKADILTEQNILNAQIDVIKENSVISNAKLSIPLATYLNLKNNHNLPLDASVSSDFDLKYIRLLLDQEIHDIRGLCKIDVKLSGNLKQPIINGSLKLSKGYYENKSSGTELHNINLDLAADNTKFRIIEASTTDGGEGKIAITGTIDWSGSAVNEVDIELKADSAKILRRNDMEGSASGNLKLTGSFKELLLSGILDVTPFSLILDNLTTNNIPEVKITREYNGEVKTTDDDNSIVRKLPKINMDVTIIADNQAYLRGRGVNAELKGKINIIGTLNKAKYSGHFTTVRGSYEILGKKFVLQNGSVRFEGNSFSLLIPGVYKGKEVEVTARLTGNLEDLSLSLSSVPSMPQDEIVSNLLFGKSSGSITPLQAIRLANELQKLKNGGRSLFNPLEETRKLIGVDNISVDSEQTDDGQEISVGVGKYINEKVYIEIEKGNNPSQPMKGSVEIEVLPNLSVESSTGGSSGVGGVKLQWKHDY